MAEKSTQKPSTKKTGKTLMEKRQIKRDKKTNKGSSS